MEFREVTCPMVFFFSAGDWDASTLTLRLPGIHAARSGVRDPKLLTLGDALMEEDLLRPQVHNIYIYIYSKIMLNQKIKEYPRRFVCTHFCLSPNWNTPKKLSVAFFYHPWPVSNRNEVCPMAHVASMVVPQGDRPIARLMKCSSGWRTPRGVPPVGSWRDRGFHLVGSEVFLAMNWKHMVGYMVIIWDYIMEVS